MEIVRSSQLELWQLLCEHRTICKILGGIMRILSILFLVFTICSCQSTINPPSPPAKINKVDVADARRVIGQIELRIDTMRREFNKHPRLIHNKLWIKRKIESMTAIHHYAKEQFMKNFLHKSWDPRVKRAFLIYFLNLDAPDKKPVHYGIIHSISYKNHQELKNILATSYLFKDIAWFDLKRFGEKSDCLAWQIIQHGDFYDKKWNDELLKKTLKRVVYKKLASHYGIVYLKKMQTKKGMIELREILKNAPLPWREITYQLRNIESFFAEFAKLQKLTSPHDRINLFAKKYDISATKPL